MKAVWIVGTNPAVSMPDAERARRALRNAELVIAQDAYHPTETTALAHVVLPAAQWPEKAGTMVNSERRITLMRAAISPPGLARADWEIFADAAQRMGFDGFDWPDAAAVYDEFAALTKGRPCDQSGVPTRAWTRRARCNGRSARPRTRARCGSTSTGTSTPRAASPCWRPPSPAIPPTRPTTSTR